MPSLFWPATSITPSPQRFLTVWLLVRLPLSYSVLDSRPYSSNVRVDELRKSDGRQKISAVLNTASPGTVIAAPPSPEDAGRAPR
ncbi:hypothetical protein [Achromobacter xylosoxidans]|uniref:hypothetical protein n=1 Tax=Alcaligenes xylosoxydans xylosoxydans TaxID=85698 RepID=UPI002448B685|nr:hypothetical protein [Achromobacter xylosoxidans]MDH0520818.1 hypothetical protein [Achromobacter xylosoxidans]MDH0544790.1 hypothetical protein [Achromobacter xylosoxidans]